MGQQCCVKGEVRVSNGCLANWVKIQRILDHFQLKQHPCPTALPPFKSRSCPWLWPVLISFPLKASGWKFFFSPDTNRNKPFEPSQPFFPSQLFVQSCTLARGTTSCQHCRCSLHGQQVYPWTVQEGTHLSELTTGRDEGATLPHRHIFPPAANVRLYLTLRPKFTLELGS